MTPKLIPAAIFAAMMATPAVACTDWKAIAAFDAILVANDQKATELGCGRGGNPADCTALVLINPRITEVMKDRQNALADTCQDAK